MPDISTQFNGSQIILPGAYTAVDVNGTLTSVSTNVPPVIYVGYGYGQKPFSAVTYASAQALSNALRGGPAATYVQEMFTPSGAINGAALVTFINASQNTQSTATLTYGSSPVTTAVTMTSANYGLPSNQLQYTVTAGSVGGIELELYDGYSGKALVKDNLGVPFQIAYLGAGTVTYTVTATALTITSTVTTESVTITFGAGGYTLVSDAVNYLNGTGNFIASVLSNASLPLTSLDYVAGVSLPVPTSGVPNYVSVTAYIGDTVWWLNNQASTLIGSATTAVTAGASHPINLTPTTHFTGATSVPPTTGNYATALNAALAIPGWVLFIDSNTPAVQALGAQHVITASSTGYRRPRRYVTGSSAGDSLAVTLSNAKSLAAKQVAYCYPGIYVTNTTTGVNTLQGGLYWAAGVAGAMAGNPVNMPLTYKTWTGNGVETQLDIGDINTLQNSGVLVLYVDDYTGVPTTASDVSTWQADTNPSNIFLQQVGIDQYLQYVVQQATQPYTGTVASDFDATRIRKALIAALNAQVISANNQNGVLNSWDATSLTLTYNEQIQATMISFQCVPVGQNRFVLTTIFVEPLNYSTSTS